MSVTRTYRCPDCRRVFKHTHPHRDDPYPPCPHCGYEGPTWQPETISLVGMRPHKRPTLAQTMGGSAMDKAVKIAEDVMQNQFGMTNMRDNQKEGDQAAILTPDQNKMAEGFWGGAPETGKVQGQIMNVARQASAENKRDGTDPMALLHASKPKFPWKTIQTK